MRTRALIRALYVASVATVGVELLIGTMPLLPAEAGPGIVLLATLCALAQRMPVSLFASSSVSVAVAFALSGLLLFGPAAAILINLPSILVHAVYPKVRPLYKTIFNLGLVGVAAGTSGLVYLAAGGQVPVADFLGSIVPMGLASLAYFGLESTGVTAAIFLSEGGSFRKIWSRNYRWLMLNYLAIGGVSLGMALAFRTMGVLGLLSFSLPLVMAWYSFRLYVAKSKELHVRNELLEFANNRLEESFLSTIRALAVAADMKDHYTHDHCEAAMRYATATAQRMGLGAAEVAVVQVAALFHDIGKIGIPEGILNKPTRLDEEEWKIMRQHPILGAKVIQQVPALKDVVPAILYHHERFDGQGYPGKLRGEEIPLAAQIVAVVDAYLAMTSDRPYRRAQSHEHAVGELRRHAGRQFSAAVVEAFIAAREGAPAGEERAAHLDLSPLLREQRPHAQAPASAG